jgi:hypothetical protein
MMTLKRLDALAARLGEDRESIGEPIVGPNNETILSWSEVDALIAAARAGVAARQWLQRYAKVWGDGMDGVHPLRCAVGKWCDRYKKGPRPDCTCGLDGLLEKLELRTASIQHAPNSEDRKDD